MALELNDLMALKNLENGNQMTPYEQFKIGHIQSKNVSGTASVEGKVETFIARSKQNGKTTGSFLCIIIVILLHLKVKIEEIVYFHRVQMQL